MKERTKEKVVPAALLGKQASLELLVLFSERTENGKHYLMRVPSFSLRHGHNTDNLQFKLQTEPLIPDSKVSKLIKTAKSSTVSKC